MLPHEFLAAMWEFNRGEFKKCCLGTAPLSNFWDNVERDSLQLAGHPLLGMHDFVQKAIPLRMHGDGVPIGTKRGRTLDVISLSSMVGFRGVSWDVKWLLFAIVDAAKYKPTDDEGTATMDHVWTILLWSFRVLLKGVWPRRDWNGNALTGWRWDKRDQPLCGGYIFVIWNICADLDYACNYLKLQHFGHGTNPCFRCMANRTSMPFTDLRLSAAWRQHLVDRLMWFFLTKHLLFSDPEVEIDCLARDV